jgi:hypothetical protein
VVIRGCIDKPQGTIQRDRLTHRWKRIQYNAATANRASLVKNGGDEQTAKANAPSFAAYVKSLHLAVGTPQRTKANATQDATTVDGEQQSARRTGIAAWKRREFVAKVLEAQIDTDGGLVLEKELAHRLNIRLGRSVADYRHGIPSGYLTCAIGGLDTAGVDPV